MEAIENTKRFTFTIYNPLYFTRIPNQLHDFHRVNVWNCLPKFARNNEGSVEVHLTNFLKFVDNF